MSVILHIRALIITNLKEDLAPQVKSAILNVIDKIDSELDELGYDSGFEVDEAISNLDKILLGIEEEEEELKSEREDLDYGVQIPPRKSKVASREDDEQ